MSGQHSILPPSSAAIRMACPGSRIMEARNPETEDSQASREGTAAHWAAAELLHGRTIDTGLMAPNGVMLDDEMVDAADMYVADVQATLAKFPGRRLRIEEPISIETIHPDCWGTPDLWVFDAYKLVIWDFKYGHRYVDAFENWQLIEYVAGVLIACGIDGISDQRTTVEMRIVQPRCYVGGESIRSWTCTAEQLRGAFNALRASEAAAMKDDAPCIPNPHCRDCRGRHECVALQQASYAGMDVAASNIPFNLSPSALGVELRFVDKAIKALEARRTGLEEQALAHFKSGQLVPFYTVSASRGRQRWKLPAEQIATIGKLMQIDLTRVKVVTPKQAVDLRMDPATVAELSEIPNGEMKLREDDGSKARKAFYLLT